MSIALVILLLCIFFMFIGLFTNKTIPEKVMSLICTSNYVIILLCMLSLNENSDSFIDIAYIVALFGFMLNLALLQLKRENND